MCAINNRASLSPSILDEPTFLQGKVNPTQCEALTMVCAQVGSISFAG